MQTKRLFKENVYQKNTTATVLKIINDKETLLILDQTVFFPEGGGQSSDIGKINNFTVDMVFEKDDEIYHRLKDYDGTLKEGDQVTAEICWEHRFDNMQRHCGEHILSGVMHKLYGGVNRGFHMGEDYMTIDISLEDKPEVKKLTWDMIKTAELEVNRIIWQNLPVVSRHFDTKEEAQHLPLRKKLNIDRDITIVSVGSTDDPSDCVACCGTHPAYTGQVGMLKIYKFEPNKGMYRLYLESGERAYKQYQQKYDILTELEQNLSAGTEDVLSKYQSKMDKLSETKDRLASLSKIITDKEAEDILKEADYGAKLIKRTYNILDNRDLMNIGKKVSKSYNNLLVLHSIPENLVMIFSSEDNCGDIVKNYSKESGCKGGGGKNNARAIFENKKEAEKFIHFLLNQK